MTPPRSACSIPSALPDGREASNHRHHAAHNGGYPSKRHSRLDSEDPHVAVGLSATSVWEEEVEDIHLVAAHEAAAEVAPCPNEGSP